MDDHRAYDIIHRNAIVNDALRNGSYDGVLGLGSGRNSDGVRSVLKQGVLNNELYAEAFIVWLAPPSEREMAGQITFGDIDDEHCVTLGSVSVAASAGDFSFSIAGFLLNDANTIALETTATTDPN